VDFEALRKRMVEHQLAGRGIKDERVLSVFLKVPRHKFVSEELISSAYEDCPLPIGSGQTISQPYMVALMSELLQLTGEERVLEIGTGSGYQSAILSYLAREVYSVERIEKLADLAEKRLQEMGINNVHLKTGDGTLGLKSCKPYDGIIVTAGAPQIPQALIEQLSDGGRLVIPVGGRMSQMLTLIEKKGNKIIKTENCGCIFVPLLGKQGWDRTDG